MFTGKDFYHWIDRLSRLVATHLALFSLGGSPVRSFRIGHTESVFVEPTTNLRNGYAYLHLGAPVSPRTHITVAMELAT
jgi:hypothetical protein